MSSERFFFFWGGEGGYQRFSNESVAIGIEGAAAGQQSFRIKEEIYICQQPSAVGPTETFLSVFPPNIPFQYGPVFTPSRSTKKKVLEETPCECCNNNALHHSHAIIGVATRAGTNINPRLRTLPYAVRDPSLEDCFNSLQHWPARRLGSPRYVNQYPCCIAICCGPRSIVR